ncbi:MAG: helix-turn-helix domain-containing protein [Clostridium sp.]|uniref:helix-turn-helix domain-containing protein n=1 Tax=Clostridium sp. TaxID=1506 RepID=UPI0030531023
MNFFSPGEKIKIFRKKLNIKQIELEEIGVSRNYISMVESDKRNLTGKTLEKLVEFIKNKATALNINIDIDKDSLVLSREEQALNYCNDKLLSDLDLAGINQIISIGEKYKLFDILSTVYFLKGDLLYSENLFDKAIIFYYDALELYDSNTDDTIKAQLYNKLGKCKLQTLCYEEALAYFFKCHFHLNEGTDKISYQNCIFNIAITYKKMGEFDNALLYINKLLSILNADDNLDIYIDMMILEANCYISKNEYTAAIKIYNHAINVYGSKLGTSLGYIYNNLGLIYTDINEIENAIDYFDKSIYIRQFEDTSTLSHSLINKSTVYVKLNSNDEAIDLLKNGISLAIKYGDKEYMLKGYMLLAELYSNINDSRKLQEIYLNLVTILKDTDSDKLVDIYIKLSVLYLDTENYEKCREYLIKAQEFTK